MARRSPFSVPRAWRRSPELDNTRSSLQRPSADTYDGEAAGCISKKKKKKKREVRREAKRFGPPGRRPSDFLRTSSPSHPTPSANTGCLCRFIVGHRHHQRRRVTSHASTQLDTAIVRKRKHKDKAGLE
ncbi:unnamed protein product [Spirodela intermedia]|uniref:Uncharacterized protein n=1 Tax=Spirodela intermedia TaxID=51605 RepID=A0A7I8IVT7_SPIIN|nr:unnamed protein product [Spirodela intermedia]CAA6662098.1 unnamed protein product [Spirodela intermedia]